MHDYEQADDASSTESHDALSIPNASRVGARALKGVKRVERHLEKHSRFVSPDADLLIPRFDQSELVLGKLLGHGGFSNVYQVSLITLSENKPDSEHTADTVEIYSEEQGELRLEAFRTNNYAVKFLNAKTLNDPDRYCIGCADLVLESKFLASLNHEHIIKLKGLPRVGVEEMAKCQKLSYFLLLDKLQSTLDIRMEQWHRQEDQLTNPGAVKKLFQMSSVKKRKKEFVNERLKVALDVASALEYLHEHRIIYRDLKVSCTRLPTVDHYYYVYSPSNLASPKILDLTRRIQSFSLTLAWPRNSNQENIRKHIT
jgi:serine/threonine protein kinase